MAKNVSQTALKDRQRQLDEIANRLRQAREGIGVTQTEFADQISISRDRLASYEEGRAVLRCDVALRACRQFFISELWLASGYVNEKQITSQQAVTFSDLDARLTMALQLTPAAHACPPGYTFADSFDSFLRQTYLKLAAEQMGFPRIAPLPNDGAQYFTNALDCMGKFWRRGLSDNRWRSFFCFLLRTGNNVYPKFIDGELELFSELHPSFYDPPAVPREPKQ